MPVVGQEMSVSANIHIDSLETQKAIVKENPLSYLNVVKPHLKLNEEKDPEKHYPLAATALNHLLDQSAIESLPEDAFYIYRQLAPEGHAFLGLVCTVAIDDYFSGHIKIHEKTITEKENQLIKHIDFSGVIGEPVLLTHLHHPSVISILENASVNCELIRDFKDEHDTEHLIYKVTDISLINSIKDIYLSAGDLYIADGHHRSAASARYFKEKGVDDGKYLCYIVPPELLKIDSFHRAFKSETPLDNESLLKDIESDFEISVCENGFKPECEHEFGLLLNGIWYCLKYRFSCEGLNAVDRLDVSLLEDKIFKKILRIEDSKTDKRLEFLKGNTPLSVLENEVKNGHFDLVFTVYPCTVEEVFEIADKAMIMPPKSTFIEPKLRTGLFIQSVR